MLIYDPDYEWLVIDAGHCKVHPHAAGVRGGNQDMSRTKGGLNTTIHLTVDVCAWYAGQSFYYTWVPHSGYTRAGRLIEGLDADYLLANREYDSNAINKQPRGKNTRF